MNDRGEGNGDPPISSGVVEERSVDALNTELLRSSHPGGRGERVIGGLDTLRLVLRVESELAVVADARERDLLGHADGTESNRELRM
jgi:hypothetical protein